MNRKNFGPGLAVLTLTAVLALAGARPAAAQELGIFTRGMQWLAALWGSAARTLTLETGTLTAETENVTTDKGLGVDPNGGTIVAEPPHLGGN